MKFTLYKLINNSQLTDKISAHVEVALHKVCDQENNQIYNIKNFN